MHISHIHFLHCYLLFSVCYYKLLLHLRLSVMQQKSFQIMCFEARRMTRGDN